MSDERKVRQLVVIEDTDTRQGSFIAVCEDGTIWDRSVRYEPGKVGNVWLWTRISGPPAKEGE